MTVETEARELRRGPAMLGAFWFSTAKPIRFEPGAAARIGALAHPLLDDRVLLVTGRRLVGLGLLGPMLDSLWKRAEMAVFDAIEADPTRASVLTAVEAGRGFTGVLGFGGGSPMNVAKLAALLLGSGEALAAAFAERLAALSASLGLPQRLREVGVGRGDVPRCAAEAMKQTRLLVNNPREVTEAEARAKHEAAW